MTSSHLALELQRKPSTSMCNKHITHIKSDEVLQNKFVVTLYNSEHVQHVDAASETKGEETTDERYWRYVNSSMSDVSQPELWMEIQSEGRGDH